MGIKIVLANWRHHGKAGVYKINFGDMFYIGKAINVSRRLKTHQNEINMVLAGRNGSSNHRVHNAIARYLHAHPEITVATAVLLEEYVAGPNKQSLEDREVRWIESFTPSPLCLNKRNTKQYE